MLTQVSNIRAGYGGGRRGPPARDQYFEGHIIFRKNRYVYVKFSFLIEYTYTNTNIGPLTKLFLCFRLVIRPLALCLDLY
ncbi:hypothetical protein Hanom_Chr11g01001721 [Helianthus anomalus]